MEDSNAVLTRDAVKDAKGRPVVYDARSYKDMGLDTVPMKSVDRIVADKMRSGKLTVLDGDFTKKMIRAMLQEALARRDKNMMELVKLDQALDALAREPRKAKAHNGRLPREMRVSPLAKLTTRAIRGAAGKVLDARRGALSDDLMERSTRASLQRIIEATDAKVVSASSSNTRDPVRRAELPSQEPARLLNEAAREEMAILAEESKVRRQRTRYRMGLALSGWRDVVSLPRQQTDPAMAMALDAQDAPAPQHAGQEASRIAAPEAPRDRLIKVGTKTMPVSEFNARVKAASAATSAFFVSLAEVPYQQRLDVIDALHPTAMRKQRERLMREGPDSGKKPTEAVTVEVRGAKQPVAERETSDAERTAIKATETPAPAATPSPPPSARVETPAHGAPGTPELGKMLDAEAKRERERKKRQRKAILARQRRDGGRGR